MLLLNSKKDGTSNDIPVKVLKEHYDICSTSLHKIINKPIAECKFSDELKLSDISPIFKKGNANDVKSIDQLAKLFERLLQTQINSHIKN